MILGIVNGRTISYCVENWLRNVPRTYHKTECGMNDFFFQIFTVQQYELNIQLHVLKLKQSCCRPGVAQRVPGSKGSQIS